MSRIHIRKEHDAGAEEARRAAEEVASGIAEHYGVDYHWEDDCLHFNRTGVDGCIVIDEGLIEVSARLGLLLSVFRDPIENEIRRKLDEIFD